MIRIPRPSSAWLRSPVAQIVAAMCVMVFGAALVAAWMVGVVLMAGGLMLAADALIRDTAAPVGVSRHESVLERYRRAS